MFNEIVERCPELFIEIIRLIPDINGMDLLSFMLVNKKWLNLIDNYSNQLVYKLLSQDRLDKEYFETLTNNNNKEIFIDCVLNFWSEYLQTNEPFQQLPELKCGDVINKCKRNMCWLSLDNKTKNHTDKYTYRHIRSRNPITKDITMYFYIKHLKKEVDNSNSQCLLFGIMNEGVYNSIVRKQCGSNYIGGISNSYCCDEHYKGLIFNTGYASNGYISLMEGNKHVVNVFKSKWKHGDVVSIKVSGIKERKISISYFNNKLMQKINNVLEGVDVINIKENRLYFDADIFQHDNNIDNTVAIVSFTKPTKEQLEETLQQCKKP